MRVDHRDLHDDLPEFAQKIHDLKIGNQHFAGLFQRYDEVNHTIRRLELDDVPMDDVAFEKLKHERAHLKDQLYTMLKA